MQNRNMLASILFLFIGFVSVAQGSAPPPPMPPPPGLPIDSGLVLLFFVALGLGVYKAYKVSKQKA